LGRQLRMTAELRVWVVELGRSEPLAAAEVGAALVAVLASVEPSGLAIVDQPRYSAGQITDDPRATADRAYQQQLELLQVLRRRVADVATARRAAELAVSIQQASGADAGSLAILAERLASAQQREAALSRLSQRLQLQVDGFRSAKETAKARFTAAEASLRVAEAVEALGGEPDPDLAQRRTDYRAADDRLRALPASATDTLGRIRQVVDQAEAEHPPPADSPMPAPARHQPTADSPKPPPHPPQPRAEPAPGLLELRADPLGSDIRILLAVEPADTVTLLAVLEGPEAVSQHGARAITLAGHLLTEIRHDGWPADLDEVVLADPDEFVARFFPTDDGSIARRADVLAATTPLGRLRGDLRLTIEEVAARSGLSAHRVAAIERDGLRTARVHEAVALARALDARLELPGGSGPDVSEARRLG
jgi:hypothetical protein